MDPWRACVRRGDFAAAWSISDAILRERAGRPCWHVPRHEQYVWDGTPLEGARVLVRCYHGLGDTIQFVRYAPLLRGVAAAVTFWAQPPLLPLLRTVRGIDTLLPLHDGAPEGDYDVDVEIMELPHVFRSTLETLPVDVPYLFAPPLEDDALLPPGRLRVGVFWRSGDWDDRRTLPLALLPRLADVPGVHLCMVNRDHLAAGEPSYAHRIACEDDICTTARIMRSLDLVISADSMPAHLAGALGVPAWVLLHSDPDWRWMENRDDTPWYPTLRLFRQRAPGHWDDVFDRVASALRQLATRSAPEAAARTATTIRLTAPLVRPA